MLVQEIGHFLVEVIGHDADLWVVAEALDSLFDVFGEDHVDPVVKEIGLVNRLRNILPMLKARVNILAKIPINFLYRERFLSFIYAHQPFFLR